MQGVEEGLWSEGRGAQNKDGGMVLSVHVVWSVKLVHESRYQSDLFRLLKFEAYGGDELLNDLQKLFNDSWRYPEADLRPDIARICEGWQMKQMEAKSMPSGSDGAEVLEKLSASLQHVVNLNGGSGLDGAVLGTSDFARLRPAIEEAWRQQLNPLLQPSLQPSVAQAGHAGPHA